MFIARRPRSTSTARLGVARHIRVVIGIAGEDQGIPRILEQRTVELVIMIAARRTLMMDERGRRRVEHARARLAQAQAEIRILVVSAVILAQAAHLTVLLAAHHEAG